MIKENHPLHNPSHPSSSAAKMCLRLAVSHRLHQVQKPRSFLRRHGRTASSFRGMVEGEPRCSGIIDVHEWISWTSLLDEFLTRVNLGPNAAVTPLALLCFPPVDFHQHRGRASSLSMT
ncbi:uncharacterized protein LACBIDRAFT_301526 [Laccaria bicolor S238N-H82]|uniref:Predicted protein n=1 Tax=Laccaria bicolor (strain S238N-H82 / ATCC MYA-4686) TaxID=486041 RepID=B0CNR2_LACBS|nr:uncharacterized protein LACBIDRAFT_301526 [Laccaria bicolor S238N-H82]EDR15980.1 predicted protein [Laccaria bicolor S238N-H82]|eukprot:XP_001874188.1 predicted protein [Laccaria bicolor S238N-H82]